MKFKIADYAMMLAANSGFVTEGLFGDLVRKDNAPNNDTPANNNPMKKHAYRPKVQHEFTIKGVKIMAASKKDAIKKYNRRKK